MRSLMQLFNSMDPSPFHEKDLDDEAREWIVSSARELPDDAPLRLVIHLEQPHGAEGDAENVRKAVHSFFEREAELSRRELRQLLRVGRRSLVIGLTVVAATVLIGDFIVTLLKESRLSQVLRESLLIGGWVAMWRPMEIFLYNWWPIRRQRRIYERLQRMDVELQYCGDRCEHEIATAS